MSSFLPIDKHAKTAVIRVIMKNGRFEYYGEEEMPEIREGTLAELTVPCSAFENPRKLRIFSEERKEFILKKETTLLVQIAVRRNNSLDKRFLTYFESTRETLQPLKDMGDLTDPEFVEIKLLDNLIITLRGTKKATLNRCYCIIPILNNQQAYSLNHAYTVISEAFEKHRISHSGNVFKDVYYKENSKWLPIASLRDALES
ncbi:MAG: hypothetical protein GQ582_05585 [Methyloprofundus sp.]|nr:hypothetical protein [Methyloprofundus sp.]